MGLLRDYGAERGKMGGAVRLRFGTDMVFAGDIMVRNRDVSGW